MFFWLSKVLWNLVSPANLVPLLLSAGVALLYTPWRRAGRRLLAILTAGLLVIATVPLGGWMLSVLENRFPAPDLATGSVDGIVVLGGSVDQFLTKERGQLAVGGAIGRLTELVNLAKLNPNAKVVFSGGSGNLFNTDIKEADVLTTYLERLGLDPGRLVAENQSRNTHENAAFSLRVAQPQPGDRWVLVTSAFHMPRAIGTFRRAGWPAGDRIGYPVDYEYGPAGPNWPMFDFAAGLSALTTGIHEWLGLVAYRVTGRSETLFPAPQTAGGGY